MNTSPAVMIAELPSERRSTQAAALVERLEDAGEFPIGKPHHDLLAEPGGPCEPVGADGGKALPAVPLREAADHLVREREKQRLRRDRGAGGGQIGRRMLGARGWLAQLTPMPTTTAPSPTPSPSIRMPANFAPDSSRSFGHLIASRGLSAGATSTTAS